jgi:diguanylate cyclase (GGDEF)-like protein
MTEKSDDSNDNTSKKSEQKLNPQEAIMSLTKAVAKSIPDKVADIRQCWEQLKQHTNNTEYIELLHRKTHTLAGTMGTYGFEAIADSAKEIELILQSFCDNPTELFPTSELDALMYHLEETAVITSPRKFSQMSSMPLAVATTDKDNSNNKVIYLVDDDEDFLSNMNIQISNYGYEIHCFSTLADFDKALIRQVPRVVIMDVMFGNKKNCGIQHITNLNSQRNEPLTTIFITGGNDLNTRLGAVRANGQAYFTKPVLVDQLVDALDGLTNQKKEAPFRILIVDDSIEQSSFSSLILKQAGMETKEVNGPLELLTVLAEYPADLILMDLYMPDCSGLELSQVIRQINTYVNIPIVYLSDEKDLGKKLNALSLGGDDFLSKPVEAWHLVSAITNRVMRGRSIRKFAESDGLTGLLNHTKSKERLEIELIRAKREEKTLSFAMLDLDFFKQVNDTYGHPAGDRVLKSLAHLLKQRLRGYDIIGRYGGEEFIVILPNTELSAAHKIMDKLRVAFSEINHYHENGNFNCYFSCGISSYPDFKNESSLCAEADKALYDAKESGRNKVVCKTK